MWTVVLPNRNRAVHRTQPYRSNSTSSAFPCTVDLIQVLTAVDVGQATDICHVCVAASAGVLRFSTISDS
jgi:hypothetical protein